MFRFVLRLFFLFLFVIHTQLIVAKEKETDKQFEFPHIIANYTLTEDLLFKMEQITKEECENLSHESETSNISFSSSIEEFVSSVSNQPKLMSILKGNNITPRDFAVGYNALEATLLIILHTNPEEENTFFDEKNTIALDNLKFGKKHMYRIWTVVGKICNRFIKKID
ncbi:hypothetical protein V4B17_06895 [Bartonella sp. B23]